MWVSPSRFAKVGWPLRLYRRIMGGRLPHSKKGKIRFESMEVPAEINDQLVSRIKELADKLGYQPTLWSPQVIQRHDVSVVIRRERPEVVIQNKRQVSGSW